MSDITRPETVEEFSAQFLREAIEKTAERLRKLAEDVEGAAAGIDRVGQPGRPNYATVATDVHRALAWGIANLHTDQIIRHAADADIARAEDRGAARAAGEG